MLLFPYIIFEIVRFKIHRVGLATTVDHSGGPSNYGRGINLARNDEPH